MEISTTDIDYIRMWTMEHIPLTNKKMVSESNKFTICLLNHWYV